MSSADYDRSGSVEIRDSFMQFYRNYYREEVLELAESYPQEQRSLYVSWDDLYRHDPDLADDWLDQPDQIRQYAEAALEDFDIPVPVDLSRAHVRMTDLNDSDVFGVGDLRAQQAGDYLGIAGHISQVTTVRAKIENAAFECQTCGTLNYRAQSGEDFVEPAECKGCERQGPFHINFDQSEFVDRRKLQLKQPPEEAENGRGATMAVYLEDDLVDPPGADSLESRVGEDVVVYGQVELEQAGSERNPKPVFDQYLNAGALDFERDDEEIDPMDYKDEFMPAAESGEAWTKFLDSMAPDVYPYGRWPLAKNLGMAFLFGAPRIDRDDGSTHRGDIHFGIFGPPGVGKSQFSNSMAELSPGCEHRSATGLSSDVGLTAGAVQDDFSEGDGWVLKPGILPRAEEHAILDEADKTDVNLSKINDALEGKQMATIDKGGMNAQLKTRVGLLCMGNPNDGRWNEHDPIKHQVDIDESLWTRFDGIVFLEDQPDKEEDEELAKHLIGTHREDAQKEAAERNGDDPDEIEREATATPLSQNALKAWVKYARENVFPLLTDQAEEMLKDFYVDIRHDDNNADGGHPTARSLDAGIRFSKAFARVRLSETVEEQDVERAIALSKEIAGQTLHEGELDYATLGEIKSQQEKTQGSRRDRIMAYIREEQTDTEHVAEEAVIEDVKGDDATIERDLQKLKGCGKLYQPKTGLVRIP